jgi:hypothetical protein
MRTVQLIKKMSDASKNIFRVYHIRIIAPQKNGSHDMKQTNSSINHTHIICITVWENRIICCQIFCDLLLKSAFERFFNVMQLILVKIK